MVRLTCDTTTQAYVERRRADGRSDREIVRFLTRDIAREIYRLLTDPPAIPASTSLRQRRRQAGVPLRVVAEVFNSWPARISQLERGLKHDADLATRSSLWLDPQGVPA
jgi:transposase